MEPLTVLEEHTFFNDDICSFCCVALLLNNMSRNTKVYTERARFQPLLETLIMISNILDKFSRKKQTLNEFFQSQGDIQCRLFSDCVTVTLLRLVTDMLIILGFLI